MKQFRVLIFQLKSFYCSFHNLVNVSSCLGVPEIIILVIKSSDLVLQPDLSAVYLTSSNNDSFKIPVTTMFFLVRFSFILSSYHLLYKIYLIPTYNIHVFFICTTYFVQNIVRNYSKNKGFEDLYKRVY